MGSETAKLSLEVRQRFCLECMDEQADLNLCCVHKQSRYILAHISIEGNTATYLCEKYYFEALDKARLRNPKLWLFPYFSTKGALLKSNHNIY